MLEASSRLRTAGLWTSRQSVRPRSAAQGLSEVPPTLADSTALSQPGMHAIARLGFLNEVTRDSQQSRLTKYAFAFDAVVLADGPMDWLLRLRLLFGAGR